MYVGMLNASEEEVILNKNTHSPLVHPVEVKEEQDDEKGESLTLGRCLRGNLSQKTCKGLVSRCSLT